MDRERSTTSPLSSAEAGKVFQVVVDGGDLPEARAKLRGRDRITVARAFMVAREFHQRGTIKIDDEVAQDFAEYAWYGTTVHYVENLFFRWKAWQEGAGAAPAVNTAHLELVEKAAKRLHSNLAELYASPDDEGLPQPSGLYPLHRTRRIVEWQAADVEASIRAGVEVHAFEAVTGHLASVGLGDAFKSLFEGIHQYLPEAVSTVEEIKRRLIEVLPSLEARPAGRTPILLFKVASDWACYNSDQYEGSPDEAESELNYLRRAAPYIVNDASGPRLAITGFRTGINVSAGDLSEFKKVLSELQDDLHNAGIASAIAQRYYSLREAIRALRDDLEPVTLQSRIVKGQCEWCPSS